MSIYRILSALLSYPEQELLDALPEVEAALFTCGYLEDVQPLLSYLHGQDLIAAQENYVATFDRRPNLSLHLFEHIHGESRDRGPAMVDLLEEYKKAGFEPEANELPDFIPLFLEYLSLVDEAHAEQLLSEAIHVIAAIGVRLQKNASPYADIFAVLCSLTDTVPRELEEPPVRDMDEALETYGPGADGVEPLLKPAYSATQPVHFYPRAKTQSSDQLQREAV